MKRLKSARALAYGSAPGAQAQPFDLCSFCLAWEDGSLPFDEIVAGFQRLIDNGIVWQLQGVYGRTAVDLIRQGYCHHSSKEA